MITNGIPNRIAKGSINDIIAPIMANGIMITFAMADVSICFPPFVPILSFFGGGVKCLSGLCACL